MRKLVAQGLVLVALFAVAIPVQAQTDLTDNRTAEEKWARSQFLTTYMMMAIIAHGESVGQSTEEFAQWMGEFAAPSWGEPGSRTLQSFVRGAFLNYNLYDGLEFELLTDTPTEVRARMNTPYAGLFSEDGEYYGVSLEDFKNVWMTAYSVTADHLGFDMTYSLDGDWIDFTVKTR
ncbi:MAG: hypothetical protein PVJ76_19855 [Gemmatimonadota bacterium]|jgi:hypothetical protein